MPFLRTVSTILYAFVILIWCVIGVIWITTDHFEPIHEQLTGFSWDELQLGLQDLILMLMRLTAGCCLGIAALMCFLLFSPLRTRSEESRNWVNHILFVVNAISLSPIVYVNLKLRFFSPYEITEPNWIIATLSFVLVVVAFLCELGSENEKGTEGKPESFLSRTPRKDS